MRVQQEEERKRKLQALQAEQRDYIDKAVRALNAMPERERKRFFVVRADLR